jgi:hypothetical protein
MLGLIRRGDSNSGHFFGLRPSKFFRILDFGLSDFPRLAFAPRSSNFCAMNKPTGQWIINYGLFLIVVGFSATLYHPGTGEFGFNPAAKTALISGSVCGGISILWGFLVRTGFDWARVAAFITTLLFAGVFTWRSIAGWRAFAGGESEKWFAATLITLMLVASIGLMIFLLRGGSAPSKKKTK